MKRDSRTRDVKHKQVHLQIFASLEDFTTFTNFKVKLKAFVFFYVSVVLEQTQVLPLNTGYSKCENVRNSRL